MSTCSAVFLVKDPPMDRLTALVEYLRYVCTEFVFVVDDRSDPEIAERIASWEATKVVPYTWENNFAAARNVGLDAATGAWVLIVDPDEWPSFQMMQFIYDLLIKTDGHSIPAFLFWTTSYEEGRAAVESEASWHCRLFLRERGRFYRPLHELVAIDGQEETMARYNKMHKAPKDARLIHSKSLAENQRAQELYIRIEKGDA